MVPTHVPVALKSLGISNGTCEADLLGGTGATDCNALLFGSPAKGQPQGPPYGATQVIRGRLLVGLRSTSTGVRKAWLSRAD